MKLGTLSLFNFRENLDVDAKKVKNKDIFKLKGGTNELGRMVGSTSYLLGYESDVDIKYTTIT